jgi:translation initiation factor IF-2
VIAIKVIELAKEKKLTTDDIFDLCDSLGIAIKSEMSVLNDSQVKKIGSAIKREAKRKQKEAAEKTKREAERIKAEAEEKKKEAERNKKEAAKRAREAVRKKAEEEKKKKEAEEARKKAEEEKKKKEEEEARKKAEEEKKKKEEEKKLLEEARKLEELEKKKKGGKKKPLKSPRQSDFSEKEALRESVEESLELDEDIGSAVKPVKKKTGWEEEKKISIKSVLSKELDKEEKSGRLKARFLQKKRKDTGKAVKKTAGKDKESFEQAKKKRPGIKKVVELHEGITIKQLSERVNIPSNEIINVLFGMGEVLSINQSISKDIIELLANEYDFKYRIVGFEEKLEEVYQDEEKDLEERAPIVTVMGHVDHGKTTLLDTLRKTEVASSEAGGITQHIGAYQLEYNNRKITFIDTPGHEAFTSIRARGAKVTDIAVVVVAADDGIMPQTAEAINHARDAGVPIIIAINKIDLPNANPEKVKQGLTEYELVPEEWGGETIVVEISAKNNKNLEGLLEMILLVADMNEIKGNPTAVGTGVIIESRMEKGMGAVGSIIIKRGKIKVGDSFVTGDAYGRVRSIKDEKGKDLSEALLSQPVMITGFSSAPRAGDRMFVVKNEKVAKELLAKKEYDQNMMQMGESKKIVTLENLAEISAEGQLKKLKIILKAESEGSVDAVLKSLAKIETEEIKIEIIHKGIGAITESDILLASAANAITIGFGVVTTTKALSLNDREKVDIRTYTIIYKLIDDIKLAFEGMLEPETVVVEKGRAEVREVFKVTRIGKVAGSYITEGEVERGDMARVVRDGSIVYEGKVSTLQRFKDDVKKVASGYECGIRLDNYQDVKKDDILEFFEIK